MPRPDVLLSQLSEAWYECLSVMTGYWQMPFRAQDRKKAAFAASKGLQFTVMPFGLHVAAATFQWLVDTVLCPHEGFTPAYLDNIFIYSWTWEDHLNHIQ